MGYGLFLASAPSASAQEVSAAEFLASFSRQVCVFVVFLLTVCTGRWPLCRLPVLYETNRFSRGSIFFSRKITNPKCVLYCSTITPSLSFTVHRPRCLASEILGDCSGQTGTCPALVHNKHRALKKRRNKQVIAIGKKTGCAVELHPVEIIYNTPSILLFYCGAFHSTPRFFLSN